MTKHNEYSRIERKICVFECMNLYDSSFIYLFELQAEAIRVNPLYMLIPTTLCTSFSFLLPVSNPPNAVVFAYGHLNTIDMVSCDVKNLPVYGF